MAAQRKTWREKLADSKDLPKVVPISGKMTGRWGRGTVVVPAPSEVDAVMKRVPRGKLITINEIRAALAQKHGATIGCAITTGIFAWIAAHAAEEAAAEGAKRITPYWRTLKSGGELNAKYPGGIAQLKKRLAAEGHRVVAKGKRWVVADFEKRLAKLLAVIALAVGPALTCRGISQLRPAPPASARFVVFRSAKETFFRGAKGDNARLDRRLAATNITLLG